MNKIIDVLRNGMKAKLVVGNGSVVGVAANTSVNVSVPINTDKILLKSVEVTASKQTDFYVEFFEDSLRTNSRYNSGSVTGEGYDVLDLPYQDKDATKQMHFTIHNTSDFSADYTIEVRGIELK